MAHFIARQIGSIGAGSMESRDLTSCDVRGPDGKQCCEDKSEADKKGLPNCHSGPGNRNGKPTHDVDKHKK